MKVLDCGWSYGWHIKSHVVVTSRCFDQRPCPCATQGARAADHVVGAFNRLDRNHFTLFDGDGLADVQFGQLRG